MNDSRMILFGPMGIWDAFRFCVRLRRVGIEYRLFSRPRAVGISERDLHAAADIFEELGRRRK